MRILEGIGLRSHKWVGKLPRRTSAEVHALLLAAVIVVTVAVWLFWICAASMGTYDFSTYYAAASALRSDAHADIYSQAVLNRSGALGHVATQPPLPFAYPPVAALLLVPLTLLPFATAARIWLGLNATLWLASSLILCAEVCALFPLRDPVARAAPAPAARSSGRVGSIWASWVVEPQRLALCAATMLVCLAWGPAVFALGLGQIDFVVLLPLALAFPLLRTRHDNWAGIALGFAGMVKLAPVVLLVYLALLGRWRAAVAGLVTLVMLALATMMIVGPQTVWAVAPQMIQISADDANLPHNEALLGAVTRALVTVAPTHAGGIRTVERLLLAALAVALGVTLWQLRHKPRSRADTATNAITGLSYAIALCAMVLVLPLAWEHHYVWVLPAAVFVLAAALQGLFASASEDKRGRAAMRLGVAVGAIFLVGALRSVGWDNAVWLVAPQVAGLSLGTWFHELRPIGAVILLILLILAARQERRNRAGAESDSRHDVAGKPAEQ
jgi:alpha-1,2-mannosyltransferase